MKLDHFVINVDKKYQKDKEIVENIKSIGFPYEPKWGKGTKGFKASNLWIGNEYFEMIHIRKADGGGWKTDWTNMYNKGHRGLVCLMLDVANIDEIYKSISSKGIEVSKPEWLEFKWFFNLLTRRMPWRNCYIPYFKNVPFQLGFQQMKDEKARDFMNQYMVPNSRDQGIHGIEKVIIKGDFCDNDFLMLQTIFTNSTSMNKDSIRITLNSKQTMDFIKNDTYQVELYTDSNKGHFIEIENIKMNC